MAVFLEDQVWRLERRVKALEQKLKELTNPMTVLGWNLAVAAALTEAYRSGMYDGICGLNEYMRQYGGVEECPGQSK